METKALTTQPNPVQTAIEQQEVDYAIIDQAIMLGDMNKMQPPQRSQFYAALCRSVGVSPLTRPFDLLKRQDGSVWPYANATCYDQLRRLHGISCRILKRETETIDDERYRVVEAEAFTPDGRVHPSLAMVPLFKNKKMPGTGKWPDGSPKMIDVYDDDGEPVTTPLKGDALANAYMKADTKAERRATLGLVGLGFVEADYAGATGKVQMDLTTGQLSNGERPPMPDPPQTLEERIALTHGEKVDPTAWPTGSVDAELSPLDQLELLVTAQGSNWQGYQQKQQKRWGKPLTELDEASVLQLLQEVEQFTHREVTRLANAIQTTLRSKGYVIAPMLRPYLQQAGVEALTDMSLGNIRRLHAEVEGWGDYAPGPTADGADQVTLDLDDTTADEVPLTLDQPQLISALQAERQRLADVPDSETHDATLREWLELAQTRQLTGTELEQANAVLQASLVYRGVLTAT